MKTALSLHHKKGENEISSRLYRGAVEASQRLDYHLRCVSNFSELFSSEVTSLRMRLKDYCERLMFTDPVEYGKKAEDLLWRKAFYDFFQKSKQTGKKLSENTFQKQELKTQLLAAIGCYNHLLLRLQTEFHLDLNAKVNVPFLWQQRGVKKERWKKYQQSTEVDEKSQAWALAASHRMLVYLGDLTRYIRDLYEPDCEHSGHIAQRYYLQAFCLNPNNGTPHNQMGSLSCFPFDAAYNYMRCILSPDKFDGAEGNLIRVFHHNNSLFAELNNLENCPMGTVKNAVFLLKFLKLCEIFFFAKKEESQALCQDTLRDFDNILLSQDYNFTEEIQEEKKSSVDGDVVFKVAVMCMMCISRLDEKGGSDISTATAFTLALFSHIVHHSTKRLVLALIDRKERDSKHADEDAGGEMTSPLLSFVDITSNKNQDADDACKDYSTKKLPGKKHGLKKMTSNHLRMLRRRRRKVSNTSQEDSELSEGEGIELPESDEETGLAISDVSQTGSCSSESLSEHEEEDLFLVDQNNLSNASEEKAACADEGAYIDSLEHVKENLSNKDCDTLRNPVIYDFEENLNSPVNEVEFEGTGLSDENLFQILKKIDLLPSLKILTDWLGIHHDVLSVGAESSHYLISSLVGLLNICLKIEKFFLANGAMCNHFPELQRNDVEWKQSFPLPEDTQLQCFLPLEKVHCHMNFDISSRRHLSHVDQMFLRIQCFLSFGSCLPKVTNSLITFDVKDNIFFVNDKTKEPTCVTPNNEDINKDDGSQKQQIMRSMTHLWLKAQANDLKLLVEDSSVPQLSPYVVVDTGVLVNHLPLLKQLIAAKLFIIVIPKIVIVNLDHLKKEKIGAREAIRWLEAELNRGTRYIRNQRSPESRSLVPMKYPKKKDKDSWDFFQILECCHFFSQPRKSQDESTCSLVTLVVGSPTNLPGNANALSKSIGVSMENIKFFYSKWRNSSKNPG